ncbi:hypothetical protein K402DRAFT_388677 [Aulographum hederae CBS 113979]|uniref:Uncharacterized protein n=1 Tax=Aulographum hederae CBS 113979 TaxID=1176131 RepID=A0A6G1HGB5_9PEZI|nr:hypothetical protein K402DRAFT_388677 [Aulographum hederae CBS 113979]
MPTSEAIASWVWVRLIVLDFYDKWSMAPAVKRLNFQEESSATWGYTSLLEAIGGTPVFYIFRRFSRWQAFTR